MVVRPAALSLAAIGPAIYLRRFWSHRVFCDISGSTVEILAIVAKSEAESWLAQYGKPAGVLIGFESEDDWFDFRLEHDPRFLERVESARKSLRAGRGVKLEDVK